MSETPQELPESVAEALPVQEPNKTFDAPKGFETKFRGVSDIGPF